jgi:enoyl-CoA hydratase/carnithine racemase
MAAPEATTPALLVADAEGTRTVTLNRPERRNALSLALMLELRALLDQTAADPSVRVIVIDASGPAFSAGHDLSEMDGETRESYEELFRVCSELMLAIHRLPQPVIASVRGIATAAGCQLVAACDLAIAAEGARFATPGVRIGLFCSTPMVEVSRVVGRKRAMEMLLTGEPIDAATAADWGLINRVVAAEELDEAVHALATRLARFSARTVAVGKRAFYEQLDHGLGDAYELTRGVMARNAASPAAQEGISAFLGKRDPVWPE